MFIEVIERHPLNFEGTADKEENKIRKFLQGSHLRNANIHWSIAPENIDSCFPGIVFSIFLVWISVLEKQFKRFHNEVSGKNARTAPLM